MDDTLLDLGLWINCFDRLWKSVQSIHTSDQNVLHTTVFQSVNNRQPEFRTFIFPNIHADHILFPIHIDPKGNVYRTFHNTPFAADVVVDRIHVNNSIYLL